MESSQHGALRRWREDLLVRPVLPDQQFHSLHAYFGVSPESPDHDGEWLVAFLSDRADGHVGRIVLVHRQTGELEVVDESVEVEDPHRQANQQWVCGGDYVIYMVLRGDEWVVVRANPRDLSTIEMCRGRQLGWGRPHLDEVPLYGPHWDPKGYRDVEMLNVRTGQVRTVLGVDRVLAEHHSFVDELLGAGTANSGAVSLFFPTLSADGRRVFLKLAVPQDRRFRSRRGSLREGLLVYDLTVDRALGARASWAHPSWYSDSRHILQRDMVFDAETATTRPVPNLPRLSGSHAMPSPDGNLMVADYLTASDHGRGRVWSVLLADLSCGAHETIHVAPTDGDGTESWRKTHPHPTFNATGDRIYFNVNLGTWSTLHVAEVKD